MTVDDQLIPRVIYFDKGYWSEVEYNSRIHINRCEFISLIFQSIFNQFS